MGCFTRGNAVLAYSQLTIINGGTILVDFLLFSGGVVLVCRISLKNLHRHYFEDGRPFKMLILSGDTTKIYNEYQLHNRFFYRAVFILALWFPLVIGGIFVGFWFVPLTLALLIGGLVILPDTLKARRQAELKHQQLKNREESRARFQAEKDKRAGVDQYLESYNFQGKWDELNFSSLEEPKKRPFAKLNLSVAKDLNLKQSNLGGDIFWPKNKPWPQIEFPDLDASDPMVPLAQINLSDIPFEINLPSQGILQFFVNGENPNDGRIQVIYHSPEEIESVTEVITDFSFIETYKGGLVDTDEYEANYPILPSVLKIEYEEDHEIAKASDMFDEINHAFGDDKDLAQAFREWYTKELEQAPRQHKLLGRATMVQESDGFMEDPAMSLLLQLCSEIGPPYLQMGDGGIYKVYTNSNNFETLKFEHSQVENSCY